MPRDASPTYHRMHVHLAFIDRDYLKNMGQGNLRQDYIWWLEYFEIGAGTNDLWFEFVKILWQRVTTKKRGVGGGETYFMND